MSDNSGSQYTKPEEANDFNFRVAPSRRDRLYVPKEKEEEPKEKTKENKKVTENPVVDIIKNM
uniref:Uncharacterized protein n=1 Tax=Isometrus maculatus TaxID=497827 RepID=A0A0U1TYF3_ISOMC|nr:hypothetical protein [Isometrus maculatus]